MRNVNSGVELRGSCAEQFCVCMCRSAGTCTNQLRLELSWVQGLRGAEHTVRCLFRICWKHRPVRLRTSSEHASPPPLQDLAVPPALPPPRQLRGCDIFQCWKSQEHVIASP